MLLSSLGRSEAPLQLRLKSLPALAGWGVGFLCNSNPVAFERNTLSNVRLALHSLKVMESLRQQTGIDYRGSAARGALKIFRSAAAMEVALTEAARLLPQGLSFRRLSRDAIVEVDPSLGTFADR